MNKLIILFFFFYLNTFSQNTNGIVTYKITNIEPVFNTKNSSTKEKQRSNSLEMINSAVKDNVSKFQFQLKFNSNESIFKKVDRMQLEKDDLKYKIASALIGANSTYYTNIKEDSKLTEKLAFSKEFIVKDRISNQKWKLINETKKIGNYVCYKAITNKIVENNKGTFNHKVVAWYTLDIPLGFGPIGYVGLPGLILELEVQHIKYFVSKIELFKNKKIKK